MNQDTNTNNIDEQATDPYTFMVEGNVCIVDPDEQYFTDLVSKHNCVVKFSAGWCEPCKAISPFFHKLCSDRPNLKVCLVDCESDNGDDLTFKYKVTKLPTFLFFKNGELSNTLLGTGQLEEMFKTFD